jgi:hypothetical protein
VRPRLLPRHTCCAGLERASDQLNAVDPDSEDACRRQRYSPHERDGS